MRYQGVNSDVLHHHPSNGKKPIFKICSKDNGLENGGRDLSRGTSEGKITFNVPRLGHKGGSSSMRSPDKIGIVFKEQQHESRNENENDLSEPLERSNDGNPPPKALKEGGDMLLQWSRKKRPRGYRPESKSPAEDSIMMPRKTLRTERQGTKPEKQKALVESQLTVNARSMTLRACNPHREAQYGSIKRNSEDMNGTHLITSGLYQRVDMHSPARHDKHDKAVSCFNPNTAIDVIIRNSTPSDTEAHAPPEKVNMETFEWPRILLSLSRKEKEDDFFSIKGAKLSQRPKKRPKNVEKVLQNCFPGCWLSDLTRGRYEVREKKCTKKKPRGLKAMESSDSDSD